VINVRSIALLDLCKESSILTSIPIALIISKRNQDLSRSSSIIHNREVNHPSEHLKSYSDRHRANIYNRHPERSHDLSKTGRLSSKRPNHYTDHDKREVKDMSSQRIKHQVSRHSKRIKHRVDRPPRPEQTLTITKNDHLLNSSEIGRMIVILIMANARTRVLSPSVLNKSLSRTSRLLS
jgi:hypothetical protein